MNQPRRLPDAEPAGMRLIWEETPPVASAAAQRRAEKDRKATSVLPLLSRPTEKGCLRREKEGKQNFYTPRATRRAGPRDFDRCGRRSL